MIRRVTFAVLGRPAPQGSMRSLGKFMKCYNPNTMPYRQAVGITYLTTLEDRIEDLRCK